MPLIRRIIEQGHEGSSADAARKRASEAMRFGAGSDGSAVNGPKACLARLADFCACVRPVTAVTDDLPPILVADFLRHELQRGCAGAGVQLADSAARPPRVALAPRRGEG
eukprot:1775196-Prymnesium_polylepis.1